MFDFCVIMAGGSGTRLWPASNSRCPKQFLAAPGGKTFFAAALERGLAIAAAVIVIAGKAHCPRVIEAAAALGESERRRIVLLPEPEARNTAPAIMAGVRLAALLADKAAAPSIIVLTSDHVIETLADFCAGAKSLLPFVNGESPALGVFGIKPARPETGYGYIEAGEVLAGRNGRAVYRAAAFREKPGREQAEAFFRAGNFYWNSGMFAFAAGFMDECFRTLAPAIHRPFAALKKPAAAAWEENADVLVLSAWDGLEAAYRAAQAISFDYAIAEKCPRVVMAAASFTWADAGSWDEYSGLMAAEATGGGGDDVVFSAGAAGCFVDSDIPVALCGVEDIVVVARSGKNGGPPAVLVAKRGETQKVKEIVEAIKAAGRTDLL